MKSVINLAKKLKALADRGIGGEKENAKAMLDNLLRKHDILLEEIEEPDRKNRFFPFKTIQRQMMTQVIVHIMGKQCKIMMEKGSNPKNKFMVSCSETEFIEIESIFDFYWRAYEEEMDVFRNAFVQKNGLLPFDAETSDDIDPEKFRKLLSMMDGIDKRTMRKQIQA